MNMRRGLLSIICSLMITMMIPFSVFANGSLTSPFVGFNVNVTEYIDDVESETTISSSGGTYSGNVAKHSASVTMTGDINLVERTASGITYNTTAATNGKANYTGTISESKASESGTIELNLSSSSSSYTFSSGVIEIEVVLDANYIGYFNATLKYSGSSNSNVMTKNFYVNGNKTTFTYVIAVSSPSTIDKFSVVINSFDLNQTNLIPWAFPIESFSAINYLFDDNLYPITGIQDIPGNYYSFPIFKLPANGYGCRINPMTTDNEGYFIFAVDKDLSVSNFFDYFYFQQSEVSLKSVDTIQPYGSGWGIYKVTVTKNGGTASASIRPNVDMLLMPIYSGTSDNHSLSTDFALTFGLTNPLLEQLNTIANGTIGSTQSASSLDDSTSDLTQNIGQYTQIENGFNDDMNNHLNNIDTTTTLPTAMGSKFLSSSDWVRVQFNRMTENTPFGSLLGFSLVLGIALLIVGKVFK